MSHANALLTPKGRLRLARYVVEDGWSLRRAAERFQVSVTTAVRWAARYRAFGEDAMVDRSSRPGSRTCWASTPPPCTGCCPGTGWRSCRGWTVPRAGRSARTSTRNPAI